MNKILYTAVLIIWGTTWLAISAQAGQVPFPAAIFHRFLPAMAVMMAITALKGEWKRVGGKDLFFAFLQGLCLYSLNFICFYRGIRYISGGMESLIFSTSVFFNALGARLFWRQPVPGGFFAASVLGMGGLVLITMGDLSVLGGDGWKGILLCLGGTLFFSLGNQVGIRQHRAGLTPFLSGSCAMAGGVFALAVIMAVKQVPFGLPLSAGYLFPLAYLAVPGSVVAFTAYLTLVNRIGAQKASFVTVMTPLIALCLSVLFEGDSLSVARAVGALLILAGNRVLSSGGPLSRRAGRLFGTNRSSPVP